MSGRDAHLGSLSHSLHHTVAISICCSVLPLFILVSCMYFASYSVFLIFYKAPLYTWFCGACCFAEFGNAGNPNYYIHNTNFVLSTSVVAAKCADVDDFQFLPILSRIHLHSYRFPATLNPWAMWCHDPAAMNPIAGLFVLISHRLRPRLIQVLWLNWGYRPPDWPLLGQLIMPQAPYPLPATAVVNSIIASYAMLLEYRNQCQFVMRPLLPWGIACCFLRLR